MKKLFGLLKNEDVLNKILITSVYSIFFVVMIWALASGEITKADQIFEQQLGRE